MPFDERDPQPLIQPKKETTRINFWMATWIIAFLLAMGGAMFWVRHHPPRRVENGGPLSPLSEH